jgi:hypothetical protein
MGQQIEHNVGKAAPGSLSPFPFHLFLPSLPGRLLARLRLVLADGAAQLPASWLVWLRCHTRTVSVIGRRTAPE